MAGEWAVMTLEEAGVSLIDCEHRTPPAADTGYPYVTIPQMKQGRLDLSEVRRITKQHFAEWTRKALPQPDDVILSRRCNPGETAVAPPEMKYALGQNLVLLRADGARVLPSFLRWLVRGPEWWEQIRTFLNCGAVFDSLKCADVPKFHLSVPPLPEQHGIVRVLGTLDDKIELNRRMSATLEGLARAVFRSWFVDFDPVVAKAAGRRPAGMTAATAALFPDTFADSPLGPIPKGWTASNLGALANLVSGGTPSKGKSGFWGGDIPWVSAKDMKQTLLLDAEDHLTTLGAENGTKRVGAECTLVLVRGMTLHHDVPICFTAREVAFNQDVKGIVPKAKLARYYVFLAVREAKEELLGGVDAASHGTGRINSESLRALPCVEPPPPVLERFTQVVEPLIRRMIENERQSNTLAALRDSLLPRLLSGELRLKDAERAVGSVV